MIEVHIPKDLDHYEAKFFGPFTLRQSICILIAVPLGILLFNATKGELGRTTAGYICLLPATIAFLFGWLKPFGMKFELFLRSVFINTVLAPSKRKYKTTNYYKMLMSQLSEEEPLAVSKGKKVKTKAKSKDAPPAEKYQPSPKAIF